MFISGDEFGGHLADFLHYVLVRPLCAIFMRTPAGKEVPVGPMPQYLDGMPDSVWQFLCNNRDALDNVHLREHLRRMYIREGIQLGIEMKK